MATRLRDVLRSGDTVCRIGGDEFVVLLPSIDDPADTERVIQKLRGAFEEPVPIDNRALPVSISLGVSRYPEEGVPIDALLDHADRAMYEARI